METSYIGQGQGHQLIGHDLRLFNIQDAGLI
jgi:hypothetical protein